MKGLFLAAMILALPGVAAAAEVDPTSQCVGDLIFDGELSQLGVARVIADGRVPFQKVAPGCPGASAACRSNAYLVKREIVITGPRQGDWTCVLFHGAKTDAEGWVRTNQLAPVSQLPGLPAWTGEWVRDKNASVTLKPAGAALDVDGYAQWVGAMRGQLNVGQLDGKASVRGDTATFQADDICHASLRLLGSLLVVRDDGACGGFNVTFTGVYQKRRR
jgi:hypothetical protein